ncbi:uncharacterized protein LOC125039093 isoform X1 [Penaeus chinensis]|uniref:uncharacterized protein LOC125039093 isoform X1 n=1 Tax=Penaeus chinensis TaxID=139456 RepID=UPI001FB76751|nr:uncharacterized protein LOC125039093 isoform X1 [Penaeus chinensis]
MKPRMKLRICFAFSLLTLGQARDCEIYRVRGFKIPLSVGSRNVSVLLEKDMKIWVTYQQQNVLTATERKWHDLTTKKNGSTFCVAAPTILGEEICRSLNVISFRTSSTTSWKLDCPGVAEAPQGTRQCRRHQLYAVYLGLDSIPASFYWEPTAVATGLAASDKNHSQQIWAMDTTVLKDVTLGRDSGGRPCRICSKLLNRSSPCAQKLRSEDYITFESIDKDNIPTISYFALECRGIPDENVTESRSPSVVPPSPPWRALATVGAVLVLVVIAVVLVVVRVRKSRSSRQAAIPADDLHDPGCDGDREDNPDYCYIDLVVLKTQLEEERRATRTDHGGETTSLRSHDSENSMYGEIHSDVSQREGE